MHESTHFHHAKLEQVVSQCCRPAHRRRVMMINEVNMVNMEGCKGDGPSIYLGATPHAFPTRPPLLPDIHVHLHTLHQLGDVCRDGYLSVCVRGGGSCMCNDTHV